MNRSPINPKYNETPIYSPQVMGMLAIGSFVVIRSVTIYQVISTSCDGKINVAQFLPFSDCTMPHRPVTDIPCDELVQTAITNEILASDIKDIIFVLPYHKFDDYYGGQGLSSIYLCRFFSDGSPSKFLPFPDLSPEYKLFDQSYGYQIFQELERITGAAASVLTRAAESQGRSGSCEVNVSRRTVEFLRRRLDINTHQFDLVTYHKYTTNGCRTKFQKKIRACEFFRLNTEDRLKRLCDVLGPSMLYGNRVKRRSPGTIFSPSHSYDLINAVEEDKNLPPPDANHFKRRTTRRGVDLCTDYEVMRIYFRYTTSTLSALQHNSVLSNLLAPVTQHSGLHPGFAIGDHFEWRGDVYKVTAVDGENVTASCLQNPELPDLHYTSAEEHQQLSEMIVEFSS